MALSPGRGRTVLVGLAEALSAPESVWSLQEAGFRVEAFTRAGAKPPLRRLRSVALHPICPPETDADAAVADLRQVIQATRPAAVLPLDDSAVWLAARAVPGTAAALVGPEGPRLELALDKEAQTAAARAAGFRVPQTVVWHSALDAGEPPSLPCVVKPALAFNAPGGHAVRGGARICTDAVQLRKAVTRLSSCGALLVQELVPGTGEGLFGLADHGEVVAWSAHRRLRMMNPAGSGSSACVSIQPDPQLIPLAQELLGRAAWSGLFMVELIRDRENRAWFVELNGRPWGSMALARRGGLEYPAWAVLSSLDGGRLGATVSPAAGIRCRHLGRELVHLLAVMRGTDGPSPEWPSRTATLRDVASFRRDDRWYNLQRGHVALFVDDTVRTVAGAVSRRSP